MMRRAHRWFCTSCRVLESCLEIGGPGSHAQPFDGMGTVSAGFLLIEPCEGYTEACVSESRVFVSAFEANSTQNLRKVAFGFALCVT